MSRFNGRRNAGRTAAERSRRRPEGAAVKVYHHRVRDGVPVVWSEDGGRLRLIVPHHRPVTREQIAVEVLADAVGRRKAWPLAADFAAWIGGLGPTWDLGEWDLRAWADGTGDRA